MKLTAGDLIEDLLAGTLSNELDRFTDKEGNLLEKKKRPLFLYINEGLRKLYAQYRLKEDDLYLAAVEGKTDYLISTEHFMEHWDAPSYEKYLWKDDSKPWEDNLLQIMSVVDHHGVTLPMNDANHPFSVFTPEYNIIQIPVHPSGEYPIFTLPGGEILHPSNPLHEPYESRTHEMVYSVRFLAGHKKITSIEDEIVIPPHLLEPLASFISSRIYSNMNTELAVSNAAKYDQNYRLALQEITSESLIQPENSGLNNKFAMRGFR